MASFADSASESLSDSGGVRPQEGTRHRGGALLSQSGAVAASTGAQEVRKDQHKESPDRARTCVVLAEFYLAET
eukprot:1327295-Pleurochrysis_carterae.AAC.2